MLVGKPERKRSFGRFRGRGEDNIRMYLREIRMEAVDWLHLAQDRGQLRDLVNMVVYLRFP
jgi:hypothetical protein